MIQDKEGFYYPKVDESQCIHCNLCDKVCLFKNGKPTMPLEKLYAYKNNNKHIVERSSSGGAFAAISTFVLNSGGVVFGAAFDDAWNVCHTYIDKIEGLSALQGSKYVQSHIGDTYRQAETFLKAGRKVLYTGTPCQIKGLKIFLGKKYENLLAVDFICHGVPSPGIWKMYLAEQFGEKAHIESINFRDKTNGWEKFCFNLKQYFPQGKNSVYYTVPHKKNLYMRAFLHNLILRPSCHNCPVKKGNSGSDIQMADFWGIKEVNKSFYAKDGVSMLIAQSEKGDMVCGKIEGSLLQLHEDVALLNQSYSKSSMPHPKREKFFARYSQESFILLASEMTKESVCSKLYLIVRTCLKYIGLNHKINKIVKIWRERWQS